MFFGFVAVGSLELDELGFDPELKLMSRAPEYTVFFIATLFTTLLVTSAMLIAVEETAMPSVLIIVVPAVLMVTMLVGENKMFHDMLCRFG